MPRLSGCFAVGPEAGSRRPPAALSILSLSLRSLPTVSPHLPLRCAAQRLPLPHTKWSFRQDLLSDICSLLVAGFCAVDGVWWWWLYRGFEALSRAFCRPGQLISAGALSPVALSWLGVLRALAVRQLLQLPL